MRPTNSDEAFNQLSSVFGESLFASVTDDKDDRANNMVLILGLAILAFAGVETVNLIFRKRFGSGGISVARLTISVITFLAIGIFAINRFSGYDFEVVNSVSKSTYLGISIFYILLAIFILVKGIVSLKRKNPNTKHSSYRGDSALLGFLIRGGWQQSQVQNIAEPLLLFAIGVFFLPFSFLWGIPLIFCAISSWLHLLMESLMGMYEARNELSNEGYVHSNNKTFSSVEN